jgi:predicted RNA-binding Zn-ribbon protein involved in translation (DUF1610 family)
MLLYVRFTNSNHRFKHHLKDSDTDREEDKKSGTHRPRAEHEIEMEPYQQGDINRIRFGRWIMMTLFKSLNHSLTPLAVIAIALIVAFIGPVAAAYHFGSLNLVLGNPIGIFYSIIVLVLAGLFWTSWSWGKSTTCPKCGAHFTWLRTSRTLTGRIGLSEGETRNYRESYKCNNCGYAKIGVNRIETIPSSVD